MNVQFSEKAPVSGVTENIIISGRSVGQIEMLNDIEPYKTRFHASIKNNFVLCGLLQGFGTTREAAIVDALQKGAKDAVATLSFIQKLENELSK